MVWECPRGYSAGHGDCHAGRRFWRRTPMGCGASLGGPPLRTGCQSSGRLDKEAVQAHPPLQGGRCKSRPIAGEHMAALDPPVRARPLRLEHQNIPAVVIVFVEADDFRDTCDLPRTVAESGGLDDDLDGRGDLLSEGRERDLDAGQ